MPQPDPSKDPAPKRKKSARDEGGTRKSRPPRPDEMTRETFEFVSAVDKFKRDEGKQHLVPEEVLRVLASLGYERPNRKSDAVKEYQREVGKYRKEQGRLFPNWSEIFSVVVALGYKRDDQEAA